MEIMKSNLPHSLNMKNANRHSYIKPPIPPKPKIIPKPKDISRLHHLNFKSLQLLHADEKLYVRRNSDRFSSGSDDSGSTTASPKVCSEFQIAKRSGVNNCSTTNCDYPQSYQSEPDKVVHSINVYVSQAKGSENSDRITPDVSSRLMEVTLEDECSVGLNSKSSSDSSISVCDSDSDDFPLPSNNTNFLSEPSLKYSSDPVIHLFDTPTDNARPNDNAICNNNNNENDHAKNTEDARNRKAFFVATEIKTSEETFVATLKLLNEDFRHFLITKGCVNRSEKCNEKTNRSDCIPEKKLDEILKYLPNLQSLNEEICADFERRINDWETNKKIADIIVKKGPFLKLYANYIKELEQHTTLLQECARQYSFFGECLREFEGSAASRLLPVSKHMLTPMQRITKYKELMKQYLKHLRQGSPDYEDAVRALDIVQGVAHHANEAIRELENCARLLCLQERLNNLHMHASPAESSSSSSSSSSANLQHVLVEPGRKLIMEGQLMKLCRRGVRVVYLIMLSDSLLYTTQELHGGKNCPLRLRYKLPLEGMRVDIPVSEDFQSEFTVISTSRSFTVRASTMKERDNWLRTLRSAIDLNAHRRFSFEKAKTAEFEILAPNALGKQAPAWVPDNRVTMCQVCTSEFSLTFRRHHCRACGKVVCRHCSANRAPLAYLDNNTERVCDNCFEELQNVVKKMEDGKDGITAGDEREKFVNSLRVIKGRFKRGVRDGRNSRLKKPDRLLEVPGGDHTSQICGYLRHYSRKAWRQSWFVLKDKVLYEYRAPEDVCALNSLPILGYSVNTTFNSVDIFDGMDASNAFQLVHLNQLPLIFYAESSELAHRWKTVMEKEVHL